MACFKFLFNIRPLLRGSNFCDQFWLVCSQIADIQPLVSEKKETTCLEKEYSKDDFIYQSKIRVRKCYIKVVCQICYSQQYFIRNL